MRVCVDPGHGGHDPGACGQYLEEADVNLTVSKLLAQKLGLYGVETLLTRSTDEFVELWHRCEISNSMPAEFFVSVHCNFYSDPAAVGIETLYTSDAGKMLAIEIQSSLIAATGDVDRSVKLRNDLAVLNGTHAVSVLCEIGFLSHPPTEAKLQTNEYLELIAEAIAVAVVNHE